MSALVKVPAEVAARKKLEETLNEDLRAEIEEVREILNDQISKSLMFYYDLGVKCNRIHNDSHKYGEGAVDKMCTILNVSSRSIYDPMHVAAVWSRDQVKELASRKTITGENISYTHLVLLSRFTSDSKREKLLESVFTKGWSVRDLAREISKLVNSSGGRGSGGAAVPQSMLGGLRQLLSMSQRYVSKFEEVFDPLVFDPLGDLAVSQVTDKIANNLENSEVVLKKVEEEVKHRLQRIQEIRHSLASQSEPAKKGGSRKKGSSNGQSTEPRNNRSTPRKRERRPVEA